MTRVVALAILGCVCAALPLAAQTVAPDGMVLIPAGKFWMGRTQTMWRDALDTVPRAKLDDRPANHIDVDAFYLDKYEVTNEDYGRFLKTTGGRPPWHWPEGKIPSGEERLAVSNVNWFEAAAYCKSVGKRLPTEAEWEKAARGGLDRKPFPWDEVSEGQPLPAAVATGKVIAVGSFAANGYGLYDMIGNIIEWTNDWYDMNYYAFMPKKNPQGPETGFYKVIRGAGWGDSARGEIERISTFYRNFTDPELRASTIGFRCAK